MAVANNKQRNIFGHTSEAKIILIRQWIPVTTLPTPARDSNKKFICLKLFKPCPLSIILTGRLDAFWRPDKNTLLEARLLICLKTTHNLKLEAVGKERRVQLVAKLSRYQGADKFSGHKRDLNL
jgi:hypothetical protein